VCSFTPVLLPNCSAKKRRKELKSSGNQPYSADTKKSESKSASARQSWIIPNKAAAEKLLKTTLRGDIVAVDFDGTCIHNDIGCVRFYRAIMTGFVDFTKESILGEIPFPKVRDYMRDVARKNSKDARLKLLGTATAVYMAMYETLGARKAFPWPPKLYQGKTISDLAEFSRKVTEDELACKIGYYAAPVAPKHLWDETGYIPKSSYLMATGIRPYSPIIELLNALADKSVGIFVISASEGTAVKACVDAVGLKTAGVIGQRLVVNNGILCPEVVEPITVKEGKIDALRLISGTDRAPVMVAGDTMNDVALLNTATRLRIVIDHHKPWFGKVLSNLTKTADTIVQPQFIEAPNIYMGEHEES
jgi:soluble P-type ATPase